MGYLQAPLYMPLVLGSDDSDNIYWWKDDTHTVHPDMRGHTGLVMSFGHGAVLLASWKQEINTMSQTETKTVTISDGMPKNMCIQYCTEAQRKIIKDNLLNKNNTSTMSSTKMERDQMESLACYDSTYM